MFAFLKNSFRHVDGAAQFCMTFRRLKMYITAVYLIFVSCGAMIGAAPACIVMRQYLNLCMKIADIISASVINAVALVLNGAGRQRGLGMGAVIMMI